MQSCGASRAARSRPMDRSRCSPETRAGRGWWAMRCTSTPDPEGIPCYRVVTRDGHTSKAFAFGGADMQRALLEADGIGFLPDGRVDMEKYQWEGLSDD